MLTPHAADSACEAAHILSHQIGIVLGVIILITLHSVPEYTLYTNNTTTGSVIGKQARSLYRLRRSPYNSLATY